MSAKRVRSPYPATWAVSTTAKVRGRVLTPGMTVTIKGERGRFRFRHHVTNTESGREWLELFSPDGSYRSVRVDRVRNVPRNQPVRASKAVTVAVAA